MWGAYSTLKDLVVNIVILVAVCKYLDMVSQLGSSAHRKFKTF